MRKRKEYEVSEEDARFMKECLMLPLMQVAGRTPEDLIQQCWERLSREMKFDVDTVEIIGLGPKFTAESLEDSIVVAGAAGDRREG